MKASIYILILFIAVTFWACDDNPAAPEVRELTLLEKQLVESDNKFSLKLFRAVNETEQDNNLFISPLSVSMALGMTLNGANGETKQGMEETLEFAGMTTEEINQSYKSLIELLSRLDPKVIFQIANSIWYRQEYTFEREFMDVNQTYFDAVIQALDFDSPGSVDIINSWVKENTNGRIEEIVDEIDPEIVMFLINAIYFKGTWTYEFDEELTQDDFFRLLDGTEKAIRMMHQKGEYPYFENDAFQAIDLPYGEAGFSMTILLPKENAAIDSLISEFNQENWQQWTASFAQETVELAFPKFNLEYEIALKDVLSALGMAVAFEPFQADFSRMYSGPGNLYISKVKHKTFVEVNEEGTEAAAVTSVEVGVTSAPLIISMRVDHPFVFVIRENHSGTILFIGKIVEPNLQ